ncbi:slipin family protein [Candidatus Nomurabacteria bacterium]|uniref:Slipin family protein n=1 Tax=candidate division WWE3 bacterium TaxID=2053526 RepID=A0A955IX66_UNCKA|nr:slipin family protein [candidate division WWE3 bacterium]MCB9823515.1 slipin family protein [Candidatus Nomurabacteria bacterium]MCB9827310.1 slipin family protein [Candidatus Nomurabacteria bacterium]HXK52402.1 slipin family protein [bacterium]
MSFFLALLVILVILIVPFLKVIPEGYHGVVLFLGKYNRTLNPGLNFVLFPLEQVIKVDIREQVMDIPTQEAITKDNVSCMVDGIVRFKVLNPSTAIFKVQNYQSQISAKAQTALRDVIGSITLDEVLTKRAEIAEHIKGIVDTAAEQWGVDISAIEMQNIEIPADMKRAMAQQAEAERDKKARIIKAQGEKEAAVQLAEAAQVLSGAKGALELRTLQTLKEISADPSEKIIMTIPNSFFEVLNPRK